MTTYTPNLKLPLYEGSDKPDLCNQYNKAMTALDQNDGTIDQRLTLMQSTIKSQSDMIEVLGNRISAFLPYVVKGEWMASGVANIGLRPRVHEYKNFFMMSGSISGKPQESLANKFTVVNVPGLVGKGVALTSDSPFNNTHVFTVSNAVMAIGLVDNEGGIEQVYDLGIGTDGNLYIMGNLEYVFTDNVSIQPVNAFSLFYVGV